MKYRSRKLIALTAVAATVALTLAGCSGSTGGDQAIAAKAPKHLSGTVSLWHFWSDKEATVVQSAVDGFEKANPDVKVVVHAGQDDEKMSKVIASGGNIDVVISGTTDNIGTFCSSGAFRDLDPYIKRDAVDMSQLSDVEKSYSSYDGKQCSMPLLADVFGLYYNKDLLSSVGATAPPKTLSELESLALKLTTYNADGSIKTLGYDPLTTFYENAPAHFASAVGADWIKNGKSDISSQPGWTEFMTWQKAFVDKIGYAKLKAFTAGVGDEFSADNAFQTGQVAMYLDGEWRVGFIQDQTPKLKYGTAPFPTADDHTDLYGGGYTSGNVAGIAKGSKQPELAWALLKYLTTNTDAVATLANGLKNVPSTKDALTSPILNFPSQFSTFLSIAASPHVVTTPATPIGSNNQNIFATYWSQYEAGRGGNLAAGLKKVDTDINNALSLSEGP